MAKKTIVTHVNPDLDAISAIWLLVRFGGKDYSQAQLEFVPAGERYNGEDNNVVHVDTGLGKFDHHQEERGKERTCAAKLVYEWLVSSGRIGEAEELARIVEVVVDIDHFGEFHWPDSVNDRYLFLLTEVLNGAKLGGYVKNDTELVGFGMLCLDGVLTSFKIRDSAEETLKEGITFKTKWGKSVAMETANSGVIKLALKSGSRVVAVRDPESGRVRVKSAPLEDINLSSIYESLLKRDPDATWYFHPGGHMILNGSSKNPAMRPSKLAIDEIIKIMKSAK